MSDTNDEKVEQATEPEGAQAAEGELKDLEPEEQDAEQIAGGHFPHR